MTFAQIRGEAWEMVGKIEKLRFDVHDAYYNLCEPPSLPNLIEDAVQFSNRYKA